MRRTLRRSCGACAKAKQACNLRTPKCSRCEERKVSCVYANEPLSSAKTRPDDSSWVSRRSQALATSSRQLMQERASQRGRSESSDCSNILMRDIEAQSIDPFDTYPSTNLPRARIQTLIYHFLSKIAYQYYPWDTNPTSNPFVTSWWYLALSDPALFHVSLQTAALDDELHAQKGFVHSEILMRDSVSLLRLKVQDPSQAFQDATMNAVVTLAAIEHGKGNLRTSSMHIEGLKSMIQERGGISCVKVSNPLTARMVSWVALLVTGYPQFKLHEDAHHIKEAILSNDREEADARGHDELDFAAMDIDPAVTSILIRLRDTLHPGRPHILPNGSKSLSISDRQDIASLAIHRLLLLPCPVEMGFDSTVTSETIRYGASIFMFVVHGATYYSHLSILKELVCKLRTYLITMLAAKGSHPTLILWLVSVGLISSIGTQENEWFVAQASAISLKLDHWKWEDVETSLKRVLWHEGTAGTMFQQAWRPILDSRLSIAQ